MPKKTIAVMGLYIRSGQVCLNHAIYLMLRKKKYCCYNLIKLKKIQTFSLKMVLGAKSFLFNTTLPSLPYWQRDKNLLGSVCRKNNFLLGRLSCLKGSTSSSLQKLWISDTIFPHRKVCVRKRSPTGPAFTFWILGGFFTK